MTIRDETVVTLIRKTETVKSTIGGVSVAETRYSVAGLIVPREATSDETVTGVSMLGGTLRLYLRGDAVVINQMTKIPTKLKEFTLQANDEFVIGTDRYLVREIRYRSHVNCYVIDLARKPQPGGA